VNTELDQVAVTFRAALDDRAVRTVYVSEIAAQVMRTSPRERAAEFAPRGARVTYSRRTLDDSAGWGVTVHVFGPALRRDGSIGVRRASALFSWPASPDGTPTLPAPPLSQWPDWVQALVDTYHPDRPR
jgi:hypothetical protein